MLAALKACEDDPTIPSNENLAGATSPTPNYLPLPLPCDGDVVLGAYFVTIFHKSFQNGFKNVAQDENERTLYRAHNI